MTSLYRQRKALREAAVRSPINTALHERRDHTERQLVILHRRLP
jgi:hypothetical protein